MVALAAQGARPPAGPHPRRLRLLLPDGAGLRRRRPPAARAPLAGRRGAVVDPQAARKDLRHEPHPAASGLARNPAPLRAGRGVPRSRARASHAEQPEDECLHEGDRGRVRHRQGADHPLR